jgi:hypothetical protein
MTAKVNSPGIITASQSLLRTLVQLNRRIPIQKIEYPKVPNAKLDSAQA